MILLAQQQQLIDFVVFLLVKLAFCARTPDRPPTTTTAMWKISFALRALGSLCSPGARKMDFKF